MGLIRNSLSEANSSAWCICGEKLPYTSNFTLDDIWECDNCKRQYIKDIPFSGTPFWRKLWFRRK